MLSRYLLFFFVLTMGVFAPPQIQAQPPAPSSVPPAAPFGAPAAEAAPPSASAEDRSIELAFWNSVQAANECDAYRAYMTRYPNGVFIELARLGERRLCASIKAAVPAPIPAAVSPSGTPPQAPQPATPAPPLAPAPQQAAPLAPEPLGAAATIKAAGPGVGGAPPTARPDADLVRSVQAELKRVNCGDMDVSGEWDKDTEDAVARFNEHARWRFDFRQPSQGLLAALSRSGEFACALDCVDGYRAEAGTCVPYVTNAPAAPAVPATRANRTSR